jgi:hypothetical protein
VYICVKISKGIFAKTTIMNRKSFFKSLSIGITALFMPPMSSKVSQDPTFKFDEIFHLPHDNEILVYFRPEHKVYQTIRNSIKDRINPDKWSFRYYLPGHTMLIPIKEEYRLSDFDSLILYLDNVYNNEQCYCEYDSGTFLRLIKEVKKNRMHLDLFAAR